MRLQKPVIVVLVMLVVLVLVAAADTSRERNLSYCGGQNALMYGTVVTVDYNCLNNRQRTQVCYYSPTTRVD